MLVAHDKTVEEVKLAAADHMATSTFEVDLNDGSVSSYPLNSYVVRFGVQLMDGRSSSGSRFEVTVWEGVLGYGLHTTSEGGAEPDDVELTIAIARSGAFALFALCAYGAMFVLACCALLGGPLLTFAGVRQAEAKELIGALAAMPLLCRSCATRWPASRPLASRRICGSSCGPNSWSCWLLRCWSSYGREPARFPE